MRFMRLHIYFKHDSYGPEAMVLPQKWFIIYAITYPFDRVDFNQNLSKIMTLHALLRREMFFATF